MLHCIAEQYKLVMADETVWNKDVKTLMWMFEVDKERRGIPGAS